MEEAAKIGTIISLKPHIKIASSPERRKGKKKTRRSLAAPGNKDVNEIKFHYLFQREGKESNNKKAQGKRNLLLPAREKKREGEKKGKRGKSIGY